LHVDGAVLLAALPKPELQRYLEQVQLRPRTPNTVTDKKRFREILNEVSAEGYALTSGELEEGLRSIAVPVLLCHFGFSRPGLLARIGQQIAGSGCFGKS